MCDNPDLDMVYMAGVLNIQKLSVVLHGYCTEAEFLDVQFR
jgi:hypothetical protein